MALLSIYNQTKLICVLILLAFMLIGNVRSLEEINTAEKMEIKSPVLTDAQKEQNSVKPVLSVSETQEAAKTAVALPLEQQDKATVIAKDNSTDIKKSVDKENQKEPPVKDSIKAVISQTTTTTPTKLPALVHHFHHEEEEFLLNDDEDISNSLATGFYFFLALSSGAVIFILFKIYRLRLSRAERKYGVQGDRSNQELTPLPISIEDGHSDDEEQIVFEVQRQNIRIL